ncbi:MAG: hypothetical protein EHM85_16040 [Desulfobacteraceae bacterium]|nr:MAG: hypothetical protein EHM85_16040 [Desulfobacteraceae bacterium]
MKKETKEETGDVEKKIKLFLNNVLTNDPCVICGNRTEPGGLDFGIGKSLVCVECAKKHAPEIVEIREEALSFAKREKSMLASDIRHKINDEIYLSVEKRILRILDEACKDDGISF